jgi:hypothetical protein
MVVLDRGGVGYNVLFEQHSDGFYKHSDTKQGVNFGCRVNSQTPGYGIGGLTMFRDN